MKIDAPIMTNGKWTDDGAGYAINGSVTLGNAIITVMPRFVVDGGTITVQKAACKLPAPLILPLSFAMCILKQMRTRRYWPRMPFLRIAPSK